MSGLCSARRVASMPENVFAGMDAVIAARRAVGKDIIDLSKANPDLPTPRYIVEAGKSALDDVTNHHYVEFDGKPSFLQAAEDWYRCWQDVSVDWRTGLLATCGAGPALTTVVETFLDPGDVLATPEPYYSPYRALACATGARFLPLPTQARLGLLPDLDDIDGSVWDAMTVLLLNYPNNPTGATASREFLERVIELAHRHRFLVVNDFAYAGMSNPRPVSLLSIPGSEDVAVEIVSLSKMYGMAGWRIGFIAASSRLMAPIREYQHQMGSGPAAAVQDAGRAGLIGDQTSVTDLVGVYRSRRHLVSGALTGMGFDVFDAHAGLFVWAKIPQWRSGRYMRASFDDATSLSCYHGAGRQEGESLAFARRLIECAGVAVMPGTSFGDSCDGYVRLSLLRPESRLTEAMDRIREVASP